MSNNNKESEDFEILEEGSIDDDKYDRQKRIAGWDQSKITNASVMIIGAGATGNEVVKNLALTGIGKIILIDFDIIEKSNLNRCVLFNMADSIENKYKVDVVIEATKKLNPETEIIALKQLPTSFANTLRAIFSTLLHKYLRIFSRLCSR